VIPELKVNGELVQQSDTQRLGSELDLITKTTFVGHSSPPPYSHNIIAGSYLSLNVIAGSVSPQKLENLQASLEATKTTLESNDQAQLAALTREELLGDLFYVGTLSYYAQLIALTQIAGIAQGAHQTIAAGTGTVGYTPPEGVRYPLPSVPSMMATPRKRDNTSCR
jgi:hypothetical protein